MFKGLIHWLNSKTRLMWRHYKLKRSAAQEAYSFMAKSEGDALPPEVVRTLAESINSWSGANLPPSNTVEDDVIACLEIVRKLHENGALLQPVPAGEEIGVPA